MVKRRCIHVGCVGSMGDAHERIVEGVAASWSETQIVALNAIAVHCIADTAVISLPRLPDNAYHHDGQLTKREVRAITLAGLKHF